MGGTARFPEAKGRVKADLKIAVLLLGSTRALRVTLPSITENLVASGTHPDLCPVAKIQARGDTWRDDFALVRNLVHQLPSLRRVAQTTERFQPDVLVFARPDPLEHACLATEPDVLAYADRTFVLVPDWSQWFGHNDHIAFAIVADEIAAHGRRMGEYSARGKRLQSGRSLKNALDARRVRTVPLRANGLRVLRDFSPGRGPMGKKQLVPPGMIRPDAMTARSA